jgi:uncharacterized DUF497 family protein
VIDWTRIVGFDWDAGNDRKSAEKHSVSQFEAEPAFFDPALVIASDLAHSRDEVQFHAFGATASGRPLHVSFTLREGGALIRVISAREMSAKERRRYAEEGQENSEVR